MKLTEVSITNMLKNIANDFDEYLKLNKKKKSFNNIRLKEVSIKFDRFDSWCRGWFYHTSFNILLSDKQLIDSFEEYIDRMKKEKPDFCLMGANDYYRWEDKGICRCKYCKKLGIVRIDH